MGSRNDAADLKKHPFFACINWDDLKRKKIKAPFQPRIVSELDTSNFSDEFTQQDPVDVEAEVPKNSANLFRNFSFVSPLLIKMNMKAKQHVEKGSDQQVEQIFKSKCIHRPIMEEILKLEFTVRFT